MRVAGLFAGIGGFESGFEHEGYETALFCEIKEEAKAVLTARFPDVPISSDITKLPSLPRGIELVCAGFPCQDLSQAGRTGGLAGDNSGLVREVFRLIQQRRPPWLVLENVPFMLQLHAGAAMRHIVDELERLQYRWAYRVVDSFAFGLPQRRERVFLVASRESLPENVLFDDDRPFQRPSAALGTLAHGFYWTEGTGGLGWAVDAVPTLKNGSTIGIPSPPAVLMPDWRIIKPDIRDAERLQGFPDNWTQPAETVARSSTRWSLVGSAVSVPVARWLARRIANAGTFDGKGVSSFPGIGKLPKAAFGDGKHRHSVGVSTDPLGIKAPHLADFLLHTGTPLSAKATAGFYRRATASKLRFVDGFLDAVRAHLDGFDLSRGNRAA